ncbi:hypothetical protein VTJ83DRAFT_7420 [Remersonia thermophila]|uniref:Major facilitator superfamily (MFS) profile domain-containing protein n=1 Tax=Remersonia thermophila TaxID=72144 RepID=A0ABR4D3F8_9PEZI
MSTPNPPSSSEHDAQGSSATNEDLASENGSHKSNPSTVSWGDLPRKDQLLIIALTRLSEPLVQTSIQSYMFYQLRWFDPSLPDSAISSQAGILHASFTAAQFLTAMMWGRIADSSHFGRKMVLLIGLAGTLLSCIGFAFSTSFWQALLFRSIGGVTNGNIGVLRTMISETVREKKYQSRAFLLLPMTFNVGVIIGPVLGGVLSDPAGSYPDLFGDNKLLQRFPYAAPNLVSAFFLFCAMLGVWLFLEETLDAKLDKRDRGLELGKKLTAWLWKGHREGYMLLQDQDTTADELDGTQPDQDLHQTRPARPPPRYTRRLPFRRIFTPNVTATFVANFLLAFHLGTFNSLWFIFLSTPVDDPAADLPSRTLNQGIQQTPFSFTGGLGLRPREVGLAMAILGAIGIGLQLLVYPTLSARLGTVASWRLFLFFFPVAYFLVPYLSLVPSASPAPLPKDGVWVWLALVSVLFLQVLGRTFSLPAQTILVNNCTPHPSVLGTVHGIGQSVSSFARSAGPILGGFVYGFGLDKGIVGLVFWCLAGVAVSNLVASLFVREGDGHEIWLEGDQEED